LGSYWSQGIFKQKYVVEIHSLRLVFSKEVILVIICAYKQNYFQIMQSETALPPHITCSVNIHILLIKSIIIKQGDCFFPTDKSIIIIKIIKFVVIVGSILYPKVLITL
jgi:hypothetical protein